ncbi:MAG: hypothetical protein IMZ46_19310, partial [Acidobacteria bacterium]|nr:hypothetical protein [Acidobacteriota bacterium]
MSDHGKTSITPLSIWDQSTSRFHIRLVLCFAVENSQRKQVTAHLGDTLDRLSRQRPDLAGRLHLGARQGWVYLRQAPELRIPFDTFNIESESDYTYEQLRAGSFPARAFVHPRFGYLGKLEDDESLVPVAAVRAFFVDGGMLLATFLHHSFGDGECMLEFLHAFSAATRGVHVPATGSRSLEFTRGEVISEKTPSFDQLLRRCPEFVRTEAHLGPNQPTLRPGGRAEMSYERDGKVFVFAKAAIQRLKDIVAEKAPSGRPPSSYVVLASLIWAHAAKARLRTEVHEASWGDADAATLTNPVNWRYRAFKGDNKEYFGNGAALAQTRVSTSELRRACGDEEGWARVVRRLEAGIRAVDEGYVRDRVEMFESAPDPRELGLVMDPRVPQDLAFNTWREFGADTLWDLGVGHKNGGSGSNGVGANGTNGVHANGEGENGTNGTNGTNGVHANGGAAGTGGVRPDKLRRSQDDWNFGGTLILPAREGSEDYEV